MEANWKEADFHKTEYLLDSPNPDLTYEIFEKFVKEWYHDPNPIIYKDKRVIEISFPSESFLQWAKQWAEINFPKSEPEVKQAMIRNLILSFIQFEVKSWHPLRLEGIHYWLYEKSQIAMAEFIKNVKEKFYGQVDTVIVEEKPALPEEPPIKGNIVNDSEDEIINQIKDHLWDREAVRMWRAGNSGPEIASAFFVTRERVNNRLSELRQIYGEKIVEYDEQRRTRLLKKTRDSA